MAGARSLLAFWIGGAGAVPAVSDGGNRSMLAPWIGGASAPSLAAGAGVRSMLAPWIGGASAAPAAGDQAAVRSLLAFWIGGAAAGPAVEPPAPPPLDFSGGYRYPIPTDLMRLQRQRLIEDEELIAAVLIAAIPGLMRRH
jgi:hypothetical protein